MIQPLMIGTTELIVIGGVVLLLFGGKKIPELMRSLGQGVKSFKEGMHEKGKPGDEDLLEKPGGTDDMKRIDEK